VARAERGAPSSRAETDHEARVGQNSHDGFPTVTAQLPPESYAQVKSCLESEPRALPSDGETRWDQRLCDVYLEIFGSDGKAPQGASPYVVVVHAALETLADESSELAGELGKRDGLISAETVRRLACDATVMVALDDEFATRCTRAGPGDFRPARSAERSCEGIDIAGSPAFKRDIHQRGITSNRGGPRPDRLGKSGC